MYREEIVLMIEKNFGKIWGWRSQNLWVVWDCPNNLFEQWKVRTIFGTEYSFNLLLQFKYKPGHMAYGL